MNYRQLEYKLT